MVNGLDAEVIVVGGGVAGIAAAAALAERGVDTLIVEADDELGGKAKSVAIDGTLLERGPNSFHGRHDAMWRLLGLLGLADDAVPLAAVANKRFLVRDATLHAIAQHPLSLLTTEALTWGERAAIVREPFVAPRVASDDESVAEFFTRRFGHSLTEHVVAAALSGVFAGDLAALSMASALPALAQWERVYGSVIRGAMKSGKNGKRGVFRLRGGFSQIGARAKERLRTRTGLAVAAVEVGQDRVELAVSDGPILRCRRAIIATEAHHAAAMLRSARPELATVLDEIIYEPIAVVHWRAPRCDLPAGFGLLAAPCEKLFAMGTVFTGDLMGTGDKLYASFVGGAHARDRAALADTALLAGIRSDMNALGVAAPDLSLVHVERYTHAVAQPALGHADRVRAIRAAALPPLALAGSYLGAASLGDAAVSGFTAAQAVLAGMYARAGSDAVGEVARG